MRPRRLALLAGGVLAIVLLAQSLLRGRGAVPLRPSLLLVTIDTLRPDRLGAYGGPAGLTPALDALAARGVVFEEALASVPLTLPSHATILTGLEPPRHGVHVNGSSVLPAELETLATRLRSAGFATGAFVGAYVLDRRFGLARGFDHYDDRITRGDETKSVLESERRCEDVVAAATAWAASQPGPFFAWVHLYDPHAPYEPPAPFREEYAGRPYDGEVAYTDRCLGRLLQAARAARPDRMLLEAVLADHGESLGEHGELTHGFFVYQSTLRIPFLLAGPGVPAATRRKDPARSVDLVPTILGRLGLEPPARLDGVDLFARGSASEAYAESLYPVSFGWAPLRSFRIGALKLVEAPRLELYDLESDPAETTDLAARRPDAIVRLQRALAAARSVDRTAAPARQDAESAERLRALGYVAGAEVESGEDATDRPDPKDRLELYRRFEEAIWADARGEGESPLASLRQLVAREPGNPAFRRALAAALRRRGRSGEAVAALGRADVGDAVTWHERALAQAGAGRLAEPPRAIGGRSPSTRAFPSPTPPSVACWHGRGSPATRSKASPPPSLSTRTTPEPGTTARTRSAISGARRRPRRRTVAPRSLRLWTRIP
jgi:arylsulfatase A-like enzyme